MKKNLFIIGTLVLALVACGGEKKEEKSAEPEKEATEEKDTVVKEEEAPPPMDSAAMMKAWMEYMTPGEMHKMMAKYNGKFVGEVTMWMTPDGPPSKSTSISENKMAMNGLYQISMHKGEFNGMPFEGQSTLAYDNAKKKFISTWIDNMGSGIMVLEGEWDEATKTINFSGSMTDPMTGMECQVRETMKFIDDNNQVMEMYNKSPGMEEYKSMEIKYTRK